MAHFLNRTLFPRRQFFAPIDADALEQYKVFAKLGFYGVRMHTTSGAAAFLRQSLAILHAGDTAIWMTPEGRFADVRDRTAKLMPGLAHLCTRLESGCAVPIALEYVFWEPTSLELSKMLDLTKYDAYEVKLEILQRGDPAFSDTFILY